jgi:putative cofactor-binding repeat protein
MQRKFLPAIVLGLILLSAAAALADGDIYVGGPWGTRINSLPFTINAPGAYYLGGNLSYSGSGNAITVDAGVNHVTLDLMGFTISGSGSGTGIYVKGSKNIEIRNGTVTAFNYGTGIHGDAGKGHRILNVRVLGNALGIMLFGSGHLVKGCEVDAGGGISLAGPCTVSGCTVRIGADLPAIHSHGGLISGNTVIGPSSFNWGGIYIEEGTVVKGNTVSGCSRGIWVGAAGGVSIVANTVNVPSNSRGIYLTTDVGSVLVDQNTIFGNGAYEPYPFVNAATRTNYPNPYSY